MKNSLQNALNIDANSNWTIINFKDDKNKVHNDSDNAPPSSTNDVAEICDQWPEQPRQIVDNVNCAPALHSDLIPARLRSWAIDIAERTQMPPEAVVAPALVALSCAVGKKIGIQPKRWDDLLIIPNLWGGLVAPNGSLKEAAISEALLPLKRLRKCSAVDKNTQSALQLVTSARISGTKDLIKTAVKRGDFVTIDQLRNQIEELVRDAENNKSLIRPYDTTSSKQKNVTRLIQESPNGLLIIKGHLDNWLRRLSKPKHEDERELLLSLANVYKHVPVCTERGFEAPAYVFGEIGASALQKFLKSADSKKRNLAMLQRIQILLYPDSYAPLPALEKRPNFVARESVFDLFQKIDAITHCKEDYIPAVRFSDEAQEIFDQWAYELKIRIKNADSENSAFSSHLGKYYSLMPSLALLFSILERPENIHAWNSVSANAANLAVRWCVFLEEHAKKAYSVSQLAKVSTIKKIASHIEEGSVIHGSSLKSIYRQHDRWLSAPELVRQALNTLEDFGWLRIVAADGEKRISLHPKFQSNTTSMRFPPLCNLSSLKNTH